VGTKNDPGKYDCYEKAEPDEPMFVLLARDPLAPQLVRHWALLHRVERNYDDDTPDNALHEKLKRARPNEKEQEALDVANSMEAWREKHDA
jgi:hypothetical protein